MLVLLTVDAFLVYVHPENGSCCMPCVHDAIMQVLSLGTPLSTDLYRPCMSVYTVTVPNVHTTVQTTHVTVQITSVCSLPLYYGTTHMFLYKGQLAVRQPGNMVPSHTPSHGPLTHCITWSPHTLHHMHFFALTGMVHQLLLKHNFSVLCYRLSFQTHPACLCTHACQS